MSLDSSTPAGVYLQLRNRIFNLNPSEVGLAPSNKVPHVWGVLIETGYVEGTATLVSLADGTASLYYSTGGGILGSGAYRPVAEASKALVAEAESALQNLSPTKDFSLPQVGKVRFYVMTHSGVLFGEASEQMLSTGKHVLSRLYLRAQESLKQLRSSSEQKRK